MRSSIGFDAVPLHNAVLCADCEVITASRFDRCRMCGSPSLLSLSRILGGEIDSDRAVMLVIPEAAGDQAPTANFDPGLAA